MIAPWRAVGVIAVLVAAPLSFPGAAAAGWSAEASGPASVGAATLRNASAFTATCRTGTKGPVTLSWTASPDAYLSSYVIVRTGSPGAAATFTVSAPATSYTDQLVPNKNDVFTYTIHAAVWSWTTPVLTAPGLVSFTGPGGKCP